jgi:hypothetical protein
MVAYSSKSIPFHDTERASISTCVVIDALLSGAPGGMLRCTPCSSYALGSSVVLGVLRKVLRCATQNHNLLIQSKEIMIKVIALHVPSTRIEG